MGFTVQETEILEWNWRHNMHILCKMMLRRLKKKERNPIKVVSFDRQELLELHVTYKGSLFSSSFAEALLQLTTESVLLFISFSFFFPWDLRRSFSDTRGYTWQRILYSTLTKNIWRLESYILLRKTSIESSLLWFDRKRCEKKGSRKSGPKVILTLNPSLKSFSREQWLNQILIPLDLEWMTTITEDAEESKISSVWNIRSWLSIHLDSSWESSLLCLVSRIKRKSSREDTKDGKLQCLLESLSSSHSLVTVV